MGAIPNSPSVEEEATDKPSKDTMKHQMTQPDLREKERAESISNDSEHEDLGLAKNGAVLDKGVDAQTPAAVSEMDGRKAWIQLLASHLIIFNTWGYLQTYGVFLSHYVETLDTSASAISWVGSVQIFLLYIIGPISGRLADAGYYPQIFAVGTTILLVGVFTTSVATQYWQLFLAQGICTGIGCGIIFCPSLSILATYFNKRRATAIGIAATGSATGGIVYPLVVQQLLPKIGFSWTLRILGFIMLATMVLPCILSRGRLPPRKKGPLVDWAAFKEPCFPIYWVAISLCFWGVYFPYYYVGLYGHDVLGTSPKMSITLLLIMNGAGIPGRLIPNYLSDLHFNPLDTMIPFAFASSIALFCWVAVSSVPGLIVFSVVFGVLASGLLSLFPAVLSSITADLSRTGVRLGMVMSGIGFACLTGPPIAGALVEREGGSYLHAQIFAGVVVMVGALFLVLLRIRKARVDKITEDKANGELP